MKFLPSCILLLFLCLSAHAQDDELAAVADTTKAWTTHGEASVLFNQSTFDNWLAGGENNISGNLSLNYDFNYQKDDLTWDNKVIASYGIVKTRTSPFAKKTDDRLEINSLLGKKAGGFWYYSAFLNFRTQFTKGYLYENNDAGAEIRSEYTNFLSPGYLLIGPGMMWKKNENLKFNLSPLASKLTFVDPNRTMPNDTYFGVKEGESIRYEVGFNASAYYKLDVIANVSFENILNLYNNYLEDFGNVDLDYQLNIILKVNRFLSTNISFQTIYDDNAYRGFQVRQVFGVGANYGF